MGIGIPFLVAAVAALLQSTLLDFIRIGGAAPDLVLVIIVFTGIKTGPMPAQVSGFGAGLLEDLMTTAPLGLHALIRTVTGFSFGFVRNKVFLDVVFMPILLCTAASLLKALMLLALTAVFSIESLSGAVFSVRYAIEIGYTALISPAVFAGLSRIPALNPRRTYL